MCCSSPPRHHHRCQGIPIGHGRRHVAQGQRVLDRNQLQTTQLNYLRDVSIDLEELYDYISYVGLHLTPDLQDALRQIQRRTAQDHRYAHDPRIIQMFDAVNHAILQLPLHHFQQPPAPVDPEPHNRRHARE